MHPITVLILAEDTHAAIEIAGCLTHNGILPVVPREHESDREALLRTKAEAVVLTPGRPWSPAFVRAAKKRDVRVIHLDSWFGALFVDADELVRTIEEAVRV
jgi:hypothetical protein